MFSYHLNDKSSMLVEHFSYGDLAQSVSKWNRTIFVYCLDYLKEQKNRRYLL